MSDWNLGYTDCQRGHSWKEGKSEEYDRGYQDCLDSQTVEGSEGT